MSYPRPVVTDAAKPQHQTPEADYADSLDQQAPAEEDLTSPIRAPVHVALHVKRDLHFLSKTKLVSFHNVKERNDRTVRGTTAKS